MLYLALFIVSCLIAILASRRGRRWLTPRKPEPSSLLQKTKQHMALKEWDLASRTLSRASPELEGHAELKLLKVRLLRETGQIDAALRLANSCPQNDPQWLAMEKERAKALLANGDTRSALEAFDRCRVLLRDDDDLLALASAHYALRAYDQALAALRRRIKVTENSGLLALAGDCHYALRSFGDALTRYDDALKKGADKKAVLARMGHCYRHLQQNEPMQRCFSTLLTHSPSDIPAALTLGASLEGEGRHLDALGVYQSGAIWEQCDARIFCRAGICAVHIERYLFGEIYLKAAHEGGIKSAPSLAYLGYTIERLRRWIEAEAIYTKLTEGYPEYAGGFRGLAWLYGVGLSRSLDASQGLAMARRTLELTGDEIAWELVSACEARAGNFSGAHEIQESLTQQGQDPRTLARRRRAMRALRQQLPLNEHLVARGMVA